MKKLLVLLSVLFISLVTSCTTNESGEEVNQSYLDDFGIILCDEFVFRDMYTGKTGGTGDGVRITIFDVTNETTNLTDSVSFVKSNEIDALTKEKVEQYVNKCYERMKEKYADFELDLQFDEYYLVYRIYDDNPFNFNTYLNNNKICFIYYPDEGVMYQFYHAI